MGKKRINLASLVKGAVIVGIFAILITNFTSCEDDDPVAEKYEVNVTLKYPDGYDETYASSVYVTAQNSLTGDKDSALTDASGVALLSLEAGEYNFSATYETSEFAFNALEKDVTIYQATDTELTFSAASLEGGLVFKEIYYTGSGTSEGGTYYADQFVEIYNNSDEIIYLDGLCFGVIDPIISSMTSSWVDDDGNLSDYVALWGYTFYVPGSGEDYPLEPRTSIVIAQDGIDHQTSSVGNSLSPVNLGDADWELYVGDVNGGKDADAAAVPNLSLLYTTTTSMFDALFSVFGPAYIIFRVPTGTTPAEYAANSDNLETKPGSSSSTLYLTVPKEYIVDAVECVRTDESKRNKRMPSDIDAGYVFASDSYNSKSFRRKAKQIIDGKVIYKDTNNSTVDFNDEATPTPGENPTTVED